MARRIKIQFCNKNKKVIGSVLKSHLPEIVQTKLKSKQKLIFYSKKQEIHDESILSLLSYLNHFKTRPYYLASPLITNNVKGNIQPDKYQEKFEWDSLFVDYLYNMKPNIFKELLFISERYYFNDLHTLLCCKISTSLLS